MIHETGENKEKTCWSFLIFGDLRVYQNMFKSFWDKIIHVSRDNDHPRQAEISKVALLQKEFWVRSDCKTHDRLIGNPRNADLSMNNTSQVIRPHDCKLYQ